jgi:transposase-like protein
MAERDKEVEALLDRLLEGRKPEELVGAGGLLEDLTKRFYERAWEGELTAHLSYEKHAPEGHNHGNSRNGKSTKRLKTEAGEMELEIPRDREASFEPVLVPKGQRRFPGFDEKVIALYGRGMTTREI